ncbi:hypothetical protein ACFCZ2_08945 [Streptomyces sp. NPDC056202]|uniref:hypothetical protein n=1 Tax=Streptomyces sp. NPDC056202 TaxID=3345745 RepID=UPI0035DB83F8
MPSQDPQPGPPLPFRRVTEAGYADAAARAFAVDRGPGGVVRLTGPCPRCGAWISPPAVAETVRGRDTTGPGLVTVVCDCEEPHPQRPANRTGCGAYWNLTIEEVRR